MERYNRISEIFWLIVSISTAIMATYLIATEGYQKQHQFYVYAFLISFAVFLLRRMLRKKFEKSRARQNETGTKNK